MTMFAAPPAESPGTSTPPSAPDIPSDLNDYTAEVLRICRLMLSLGVYPSAGRIYRLTGRNHTQARQARDMLVERGLIEITVPKPIGGATRTGEELAVLRQLRADAKAEDEQARAKYTGPLADLVHDAERRAKRLKGG